jgi:hypothetical protein
MQLRSVGRVSDDPLAPLAALPRVGAAVGSARSAVDRLLSSRVVRRRSNEVSAESALRGAWASSVLSGVPVDLATIRSGDATDPVVQGALRVSAELGPLAATWRRAPAQVLARLHVLAAADLVSEPAALGRPGGGTATAQRLAGLASTVVRTRAPAVVVAAVVLGEILGLDAFVPSSTVVAFGAVRLTLVEFGLDLKSLVVVEVGAVEERAATPAALDGYRSGSVDGLSTWIEHVAQLIVLGAQEAMAICTALERG